MLQFFHMSKVSSAQETFSLGENLALSLSFEGPIAFFGELGAGKTTLIKGIVSTLTGIDRDEIVSPTFNYLNVYEGKKTVYHFDLYKLAGAKDFFSLGFNDLLVPHKIVLIEWAERITAILPKNTTKVSISQEEGDMRTVSVTPWISHG